MHYDVLTASVIKNPHRSVRLHNYKGSVSYLERSFRQHRLSEIEHWERLGVVQQALEGKVPSRRVYTETLLDHFLDRSTGMLSQEDVDRREKIIAGLWSRGASRHQDKFNTWLMGAAGLPFGDVLLEHGADPHQTIREGVQSPHTAFMSMLDALASTQNSKHASYLKDRVPQGLEGVLTARIEKCLLADIQKDLLDNYLVAVVSLGVRSKSKEDEKIWVWLCDQLISKGAVPTFADRGAFSQSCIQRPTDVQLNINDLRDFTRQCLEETGIEPSMEEKDVYAKQLYKQRADHWSQRCQQWTETLLRAIDKPGQKSPGAASHHFWDCLLHTPGGVERGNYLLKKGVAAPWQTPHTQGSRVNSLFFDWNHRRTDRLESFMSMVEGTSVDPVWAKEAISEYLMNHRSHGRADFASNEDLMLSSRLLGWSSGELPQPMFEYITKLPYEWSRFKTPQEERQQMLSFIHGNGWLESMCSESWSGPRSSGFIERWTSDKSDFALLEGLDPRYVEPLRKQASLVLMGQRDREVARYWIHQALEVDPSHANVVYDATLKRYDTDQRVSYNDCIVMFSVMAALHEKGWQRPAGKSDADILLIALNNVNDNWPVSAQQEVAQWMQASGLDLNDANARILSYLLEQEESLSENMSSVFSKIMPIVMRLVELGADPSLLSPMQANGRPLCDILYIEQQRMMMQKSTPQTASQRSRRL